MYLSAFVSVTKTWNKKFDRWKDLFGFGVPEVVVQDGLAPLIRA